MGAKVLEGRKVVTRDYCGEDRPHFLPSGSTRAVVEATLDQIFRRELQCHQAEGVPAPLLEIPPSITPLVQLPSSVPNVCQIQITRFPLTHNQVKYWKHIKKCLQMSA